MTLHDFCHVLETKKEAGTKSAQLLCLRMINDKTQKSGTNQFRSAAEN